MDQFKNVSKIETIPEEIFREIFLHLSSKDIFSLGETSKRLSYIVANNVTHPLSTKLQYLKTKKKHYEKLSSPYDNIPPFPYSNVCAKEVCECQLYYKRKNLVVIDPLCCVKCRYAGRGIVESIEVLTWDHCSCHQVLIPILLNISLCPKCETNNIHCQDCICELKSGKEMWTLFSFSSPLYLDL